MNKAVRKKVLSKMIKAGLITLEQVEKNEINNVEVEYYARGIKLLDGSTDIDSQIRLRELLYIELASLGKGKSKKDLKDCEKVIKKLKKLKKEVTPVKKEMPIKMNFSGAKTQLEEVRFHLEEFGTLTTFDCFLDYGITRLSQYILLLRKEGKNIVSERIKAEKKNRYGNHVSFVKYTLIKKKDGKG